MEQIDEWPGLEELEDKEEADSQTVQAEIRSGLAKKIAQRVLKGYGATKPPVPIEDIARRLGFGLEIRELPRGVDARLVAVSSTKVIQLARGQAAVRHRFSIAHELGHHFLGHSHGEGKAAEVEANAFAGELLIPRAWLARDLKQGLSIADVIERYQVSREVVFVAAKNGRLLGRL
jgi:hypothetical protein